MSTKYWIMDDCMVSYLHVLWNLLAVNTLYHIIKDLFGATFLSIQQLAKYFTNASVRHGVPLKHMSGMINTLKLPERSQAPPLTDHQDKITVAW